MDSYYNEFFRKNDGSNDAKTGMRVWVQISGTPSFVIGTAIEFVESGTKPGKYESGIVNVPANNYDYWIDEVGGTSPVLQTDLVNQFIGNKSLPDSAFFVQFDVDFNNFASSVATLMTLPKEFIVNSIDLYIGSAFDTGDIRIYIDGGVTLLGFGDTRITSLGRKISMPTLYDVSGSDRDIKMDLSGSPSQGQMYILINVQKVNVGEPVYV